jgi:hypothetical protein
LLDWAARSGGFLFAKASFSFFSLSTFQPSIHAIMICSQTFHSSINGHAHALG